MGRKRKPRILTKIEGITDASDSPTSESGHDLVVTYCCDETGVMVIRDAMAIKKRCEHILSFSGIVTRCTCSKCTEAGNDMVETYCCDENGVMIIKDVMAIQKRRGHILSFSSIMSRHNPSKCTGRQQSGKRPKLDAGTFDVHLETIWRSFSEDKRAAFSYLGSFYFLIYRSKQTRALELIKRKNIFSKKYVFVPIVGWDHWRLVILCHFGEEVHSTTRTRCILLLDSAEISASVIEPDVREFIYDIFKVEGRPESKDVVYRIPLRVPKVPQQTNDVDCGRFVLFYIKLFMDTAPENFSLSNGYPYFLKSNWFEPECFAKFCDKLDEETPTPDQEAEQVPRCSQRIRSTRVSAHKSSRQDGEAIVVDDSETSEGSNIF